MEAHDGRYTIVAQSSEVRLDRLVSEHLSLSRSRVVTLIENGNLTVNGRPCNKKDKLCVGDLIELVLSPHEDIDADPQDIPLDIVYEDDALVVVNKPQGMVVHPAPGNPDGTLVNALLFHCKSSLSGINGKLRPGIVHRIDKDTSGLLIVAKNDDAHNGLAEMFKNHSFTRIYHAILYGNLKEDEGTVALAIGRSKKDRKKMAAFPMGTDGAKDAITHYRVLERFKSYCYVELRLETGRTHQIRVHMKSLGHPVLADPVYAVGRETLSLSGQCLHAKVIGFIHPTTKAELFFDSELPDYFKAVLEKLRKL